MITPPAIVLTAGQGTRMKSDTPKALHQLCGREMIGVVVDNATAAGIGPIVVVIAPNTDSIKDSLDGSARYAVQDEPLGTGHAVLQARGMLPMDGHVMLLNGDVPLVKQETFKAILQRHAEKEAVLTVLTSTLTEPAGLGRVVRGNDGSVQEIVEERAFSDLSGASTEINAGVYFVQSRWLWDTLPKLEPSETGEIYLTDLVTAAAEQGLIVESVQVSDGAEAFGVNNRIELARAEAVLRQRIRENWMLEGVSMPDPSSVYIDYTAKIGQDTVILPNTHITGRTAIGPRCKIGPNSIVSDSTLGSDCEVQASVIEDAVLEDRVDVGPFSHLRSGSYLERDVHIGNYSEVKNSRLGIGTKSGHFSYLGDAEIGANVNIGAGSITCNFDGEQKSRTIIGDDVFIGCDTMMVAPLTIGARSYTGTGSVINKDVPPDSGAIGAPARIIRKKPDPNTQDSG